MPAVGEGGCEVDDKDDELIASSFRLGGDALALVLSLGPFIVSVRGKAIAWSPS